MPGRVGVQRGVLLAAHVGGERAAGGVRAACRDPGGVDRLTGDVASGALMSVVMSGTAATSARVYG